MKAAWMCFMVIVLLLPCAYGQSLSSPSPDPSEKAGGAIAVEQTPPAAENIREAESPRIGFSYIRAAGGMGLVLCLIIGIYVGVKKFAPRFLAKGVSDKNLKLIETLSMGDRRSVSLIEVASQRYLVGNTPNQISLIAALPEALSVVSQPEEAPPKPKEKPKYDPRSPFRSLFEAEKTQSPQIKANPLPEDIRTKMRQLRDALER